MPCGLSFPELSKLALGISVCVSPRHLRQVNFPNLLSDAVEISGILYTAAGESLVGTPTMIVYNPQGELAAVQPGPVMAQDLIRFIQREEQQSAAQ